MPALICGGEQLPSVPYCHHQCGGRWGRLPVVGRVGRRCGTATSRGRSCAPGFIASLNRLVPLPVVFEAPFCGVPGSSGAWGHLTAISEVHLIGPLCTLSDHIDGMGDSLLVMGNPGSNSVRAAPPEPSQSKSRREQVPPYSGHGHLQTRGAS